MRRILVITSVFLFATAMAVAQDSSQSTMSSTQQPTVDSNNLRGCLTAGGDQFKLTTDVGAKTINLNVDKQAATPYVAHEVEVQGMTTSDGNFKVDRILDIADHCGHSGQPTTAQSGAMGATDANAGQQTNVGAASSTAPNATQQVPPTDQSSAVANPSATTTTPENSTTAAATPATSPDQTATSSSQAANPPASTDVNAQASTSSTTSPDMSAQNATQPPASSSVATQPAPDQSAVATEQKPEEQKPAEQSATSTTTQSSTTSTADQNAAAAPADQHAKSELPQTASPLPLLGLLGLGSIGAGLISRKRK